ncbi:DUF2778 domain-containing protein [Agarivorans gilvus]|uniref:Tlde1 domain-containing protein n=1 Tax=Agarivorans gilvus TaxID=680279 RepID=A0ABQ1I5T7_9ALTE|nr:DUF2778 domain-containing protein [Agarivorans gilvus]GGB15847.1 hypothetical protein GCM10007414_31660 [Agarivorans gilvus]
MLEFTFELNGKELSDLVSGEKRFPAYSGQGSNKNKPESMCVPNHGPIPRGTYYIVARESGGLMGPLRDLFSSKDEWFALYAKDKNVDDFTFCETVKRGNFRLHPEGPLGISKGCITIKDSKKYKELRKFILQSERVLVPGTTIRAYGTVEVL